MNSEHFRPTQFVDDEARDKSAAPAGGHNRGRAVCYRTPACKTCSLKPRCTPGAQRAIHRLVDQGALDRMEARIYADPSLMQVRRCAVEHPFGTIKWMSGRGGLLTRGLRKLKAEAAFPVLAFSIIHAVNAFGAEPLTGAD
ncbi:transposase [Methylobacterium isbiliense]|jgi:transposase|uniref:Transposase DDE domain-containing protein n=1 Tax=Methylobacterium isbiliense TaxID=315478 RepID=A0ABQ4SRL1_9HYPH|nr:transposase [Methylobacterium isbiliense]MDN3627043.1 transposase [Methylobacterium isbiliense]GJE04434.1 hypothetical protein GMJLKIPL_6398 [Methylobacterium isbiliense]